MWENSPLLHLSLFPHFLPLTLPSLFTLNGQQHNIMFTVNASDIYSHDWYHLKGLCATGAITSILQEVD